MTEEWLTTNEVMALCGWNDRRMVHRAALREKWRTKAHHSYHSENLYCLEDVRDYLRCRQRTELVGRWRKDKGGKLVRGLVRDPRYDAICPVCKKYAVFEPPLSIEDALIFSDDIKRGYRKTRCENNHEAQGGSAMTKNSTADKMAFTAEEIAQAVDTWANFNGFSGETCSCGKKANVLAGGAGWFCPSCDAYNAQGFHDHRTPHEKTDFGPSAQTIQEGYRLSKKHAELTK